MVRVALAQGHKQDASAARCATLNKIANIDETN